MLDFRRCEVSDLDGGLLQTEVFAAKSAAQNYKHVKTLGALLKDILPPEHLHFWVVFTGSAEFKTAMPVNVTHAYKLISKL